MTEPARTIFAHFEVRKTKKQKQAFRDWAKDYAAACGYEMAVERGSFGARNLVFGDPPTAGVIYTAHYDTCARLPFPNCITPKCIPLFFLYQLAICLLLVGLPALAELLLLRAGAPFAAAHGVFLLLLTLLTALMLVGPANPHTANDNTSGVITVLEIMRALPAGQRGDVAFILFDLEEAGLLGSSSYASKHKRALRGLLVNFDCVSAGSHFLFIARRGSRADLPALTRAFLPDESHTVEFASRGVIYPSDQASFRRGIGVTALRRTRRGLLYLSRIHTPRDTVFESGNIDFLVAGALRLAGQLGGRPT